jgi:hypothetical protein
MQEIFNKVNILDIQLYNFLDEALDISKLFLRINIYESIFEKFLSGKIVLTDTQDLIANFPIIGNERLRISFEQNKKIIDLDFRVYKVDGDQNNTKGIQKFKTFILYFCSVEKLKSNKISKKFSGKAETIIDNILNSNKEFVYQKTLEDISFVSNFWSVQKIIDFILKITKSSTYSDYVFYETLENLTFSPISYLHGVDITETIVYDLGNDNYIKNNNIKTFKFERYFNILENKMYCMFGKTLYNCHSTEYSFKKTCKSLSEFYDNITSLGKHIPFDKNLFSNESGIDVNYYEPEVSIIRNICLSMLRQYNIIIKMNGLLSRKCGQVIKIDYPSTYNDEIYQKSFDGKWFVVGINHSISNDGGFDQNLLMSKNAKFNFDGLELITGNVNI